MYRNALVATDGSNVARSVFAHVPQVVEADGQVLVIEVVDDIAHVFARSTPAGFEIGAMGYDPGLAEQVVEAQRAAATKHLQEARQELERLGLRNVETLILSGTPGDAIVREVESRGIDVVLMGTHGRSGLRRTVLGSVADYVLRHLDATPGLLIHAPED